MIRLNNDQITATVWLAIGATIAVSSCRYGLGVLNSPGTGFMPFLSGTTISFFAFIGLVSATIKKKKGIGWKSIIKGFMWEKTVIVIVALVVYTLLLNTIGFLLCTALFIGFLLRAVQPQRWIVVFMGSILTALGAYLIFEVWLQAQLPKGPWGV